MGLVFRVSFPEKNDDEDEWWGEGLRFTCSCTASKAHVSRDLNEYLLDIRAISMSCVKSALDELTTCNSGGLDEIIS